MRTIIITMSGDPKMIFELIYNYFYEDFMNDYIRKPLNAVDVTELISCPKKRLLKRLFPEEYVKIYKNPHILLGLLAHKGFETILKEQLIPTEVEKTIEVGDYIIRGKLDGYYQKNGMKIGLELKTTRKTPNEVRLINMRQVQIYASLFDLDAMEILYISPNDYKAFLIQFSDNDKIDIEKTLYEYLKEKEPKFSWECNYCIFKNLPKELISNVIHL